MKRMLRPADALRKGFRPNGWAVGAGARRGTGARILAGWRALSRASRTCARSARDASTVADWQTSRRPSCSRTHSFATRTQRLPRARRV